MVAAAPGVADDLRARPAARQFLRARAVQPLAPRLDLRARPRGGRQARSRRGEVTAAGEPARIADTAWLTEGALGKLMAVLDRDGEEARVVGGAVRNVLIGEPTGDIDVATTALPPEVMRRAQAAGFKAVPTGIEHGTVTIVVDHRPFEVTTLREDVETFGRHAVVRFGRDWRADAARRDFTINALSLSRDGVVHDYVGGLADIAVRRVRFIGQAAARIAEDYLRVLRFFRFHAADGSGLPDPEGLPACIDARHQPRPPSLAWARSAAGAADAQWRAMAALPQRWTAPAFPIKAADLMARGIAKGRGLGAALAQAEQAWIARGFPADKAALAEIADAVARETIGRPAG